MFVPICTTFFSFVTLSFYSKHGKNGIGLAKFNPPPSTTKWNSILTRHVRTKPVYVCTGSTTFFCTRSLQPITLREQAPFPTKWNFTLKWLHFLVDVWTDLYHIFPPLEWPSFYPIHWWRLMTCDIPDCGCVHGVGFHVLYLSDHIGTHNPPPPPSWERVVSILTPEQSNVRNPRPPFFQRSLPKYSISNFSTTSFALRRYWWRDFEWIVIKSHTFVMSGAHGHHFLVRILWCLPYYAWTL